MSLEYRYTLLVVRVVVTSLKPWTHMTLDMVGHPIFKMSNFLL
jgi:hypothetical protein